MNALLRGQSPEPPQAEPDPSADERSYPGSVDAKCRSQ